MACNGRIATQTCPNRSPISPNLSRRLCTTFFSRLAGEGFWLLGGYAVKARPGGTSKLTGLGSGEICFLTVSVKLEEGGYFLRDASTIRALLPLIR